MRILKVANVPNNRNTGMGRVMHNSADELRKLGHTVDFLFSEDVPRAHPGKLDRLVFPVALVKAVRSLMRRRGRYDIVEIHEPSAAWYCLTRRRDRALPPCVLMCHGVEGNYWRHLLELDRILGRKTSLKSRVLVPLTLLSQAWYALRHCEQVLCLNTLDEKFLREVYHIPEARVSRIQSGVAEHFFVTSNRSASAPARLLFIGSWLDNKGGHFLLQAFERLQEGHPDLQLSLLGTGYDQEHILASVPQSIRHAVTVVAKIGDHDLIQAYTTHDVLILPSYFESWGLVLLEAAAAGMAIVASRTGGPSDIFTDQRDALLIPRADARAIEEAVHSLLQDIQLRRQLGQRAQLRARQLSWHAAAQSYVRAYECALQVAH